MKRNGGGRFVFIASSAGLFGQPTVAHYAAAKAGTLGFANAVAIEGADHRIWPTRCFHSGNPAWPPRLSGQTRRPLAGFLDAISPDLVVPLVVFLASQSCTATHQAFSAGAGGFARVFVGLATGWAATPATVPTVEDIACHLDAITAPEPYSIPMSIFDDPPI